MNMPSPFRIRSFGRRHGRLSKNALGLLSQSQYCLKLSEDPLDLVATFGEVGPCHLEIGFGTGHSLLNLAKQYPSWHFIGIETYQPAVVSLLAGIKAEQVNNIRIYQADVIDVLTHCIPMQSLTAVQIFFPDPWPKRRHHHRRLIQPEFLKLVANVLEPNGQLHLATDWEHYAKHMLTVINASHLFQNRDEGGLFSSRSYLRPIKTKFEQHALLAGREIWELQWQKR